MSEYIYSIQVCVTSIIISTRAHVNILVSARCTEYIGTSNLPAKMVDSCNYNRKGWDTPRLLKQICISCKKQFHVRFVSFVSHVAGFLNARSCFKTRKHRLHMPTPKHLGSELQQRETRRRIWPKSLSLLEDQTIELPPTLPV
jgi:hypothetical protein